MSLSTPVDAFTVERAAEAAYHAAMTFRGDNIIHEDWANLSAYWKRLYRVQAEAVLGVLS